MPRFIVALLFSASISFTSVADCAPITILIDTSPITGTAAQLALDFIDGGLPANSVTITGFATDGTLGGSSATGGVSGTLPGSVVLTDASFFNELLTAITLGATLSFTFDATANAGITPDGFSVFLLNAAGTASLFPTSDPLGADALLAFDITGGAGSLTVFDIPGQQVSITVGATAVPEPATLVLVGASLFGFSRQVWKRRQACSLSRT